MFTLDQVVLWGRSFDEYRRMFALRRFVDEMVKNTSASLRHVHQCLRAFVVPAVSAHCWWSSFNE